MLHYFAKLGRKPSSKLILPFVGFCTTSGYLLSQQFCHGTIQQILASQDSSGQLEAISPELKRMIIETLEEHPIKRLGYNTSDKGWFKDRVCRISWFLSSTMEPVVFGCLDFKQGLVIGLPNYYRFSEAEDLPESSFEIHKFKIFKNWFSKEASDQEKDDIKIRDSLQDDREQSLPQVCKRIDRASPEGKEYVDSLLLSENAKKFAIAKQLRTGYSFKLLSEVAAIGISFISAIVLARLGVLKLSLLDRHLSHRLPVYALSTIIGFYYYKASRQGIDALFDRRTNTDIIKVSEDYRIGAIEYYSKLIRRNKVLRQIDEDMQSIYNEEGNFILPWLLTIFTYPLTEQLKDIEEPVKVTE